MPKEHKLWDTDPAGSQLLLLLLLLPLYPSANPLT